MISMLCKPYDSKEKVQHFMNACLVDHGLVRTPSHTNPFLDMLSTSTGTVLRMQNSHVNILHTYALFDRLMKIRDGHGAALRHDLLSFSLRITCVPDNSLRSESMRNTIANTIMVLLCLADDVKRWCQTKTYKRDISARIVYETFHYVDATLAWESSPARTDVAFRNVLIGKIGEIQQDVQKCRTPQMVRQMEAMLTPLLGKLLDI